MKFSMTLNRYLAGSYILNLLFILVSLLSVIYLFDMVELLRRAGKRDVPVSVLFEMGLLKLPEIGQMLIPFAVLFSAMFTFWQLTKRYELIIVRAAGFSIWQFLAPVMAVAVLAGVMHVMVLNPLSSILLTRFQVMENEYLEDESHYVSLMEGGLWLRQTKEDGHVILHGQDIDLPDWKLQKVMVLFFDDDDNFERRIEASSAQLEQEKGFWVFDEAVSYRPGEQRNVLDHIVLPTHLTIRDLEESFADPQTLSFWELPSFIKTMETAGFDATALKVHYQSLLSQPFMFLSMILLAASVSLRPPRFRGTLTLVIAGLVFGFTVFFMTSFLQALGVSHQIPSFLAAWSPAIVTSLLGISAMLMLEDG